MRSELHIRWLGHSCFRFEWNGCAVVTDPYEDNYVPGLPPLQEDADAVFCSHGHKDHNADGKIRLTGNALPAEVSVRSFDSFHDHHEGAHRGANRIHLLQFGPFRAVHMGDVGCMPAQDILQELHGCDVLLIPVGGHYTIGAAEALEVCRAIEPRCIVPMHYRGESFGYEVIAPVEDFISLFPACRRLEAPDFLLAEDAPAGLVVPAFPF